MADRHDPKTLVNNMVVDAKALVNDNLALAKSELSTTAKHAGIGGGMFGAAGYMAVNGVSLLFMAGGLAIGLALAHLAGWGVIASVALGFVIMAIILFIIAGILALLGKKQIKQVGPPKQTIEEVKTSVDSVKRSLKGGVDQVNSDVRDRKALAEAKKAAKDVEVAPRRSVVTTEETGFTGGAHRAPTA